MGILAAIEISSAVGAFAFTSAFALSAFALSDDAFSLSDDAFCLSNDAFGFADLACTFHRTFFRN
jgi:hypothetical protein